MTRGGANDRRDDLQPAPRIARPRPSYLTFARGTRLIVEKEWRSHAHRRLAAQAKQLPAPAPGELPEDEPPTSTWASPLEGWDEPTMAYPSVRES